MPDPILPGRPGLYLSMVHYGPAHNRDFAREHYAFFMEMLNYLGDISGKTVLDVGCGKSFWLTLLLHNYGADVTGIDTEVVQPGTNLEKYVAILKNNGVERALRTFMWEQIFARPYYNELEKLCKKKLVHEGVKLKAANSAGLDFDDNTFDYVVSHEVFEHIEDVPATLKGLNRIMKPESRTYIYVHNYTSLSGGHHIAWKYPDKEPSRKVPPWDHLRKNTYPYIPSWLNKKRMHEYRADFDLYFKIEDWIPVGPEGTTLLTNEIRNELSEYTEEELLTKGFIVVAKPRK